MTGMSPRDRRPARPSSSRPIPHAASRRQILMRAFVLVIAAGLAGPAAPAPLPAADEQAIRAVVRAQLDAFAADDAPRAFSFAAPAIREQFRTPRAFMEMVRATYPMIYRQASAAFLKPEQIGEVVIQRVQVIDLRGDAWLAVYSVERQKDRSWRISGCQVVESRGRTA